MAPIMVNERFYEKVIKALIGPAEANFDRTLPFATLALSTAQYNRSSSCESSLESSHPPSFGVDRWESAIQKSRRKCLGLDGSMKLKSKAGRSGKSSSMVCKVARYASPQNRLQKLNECKRLANDSYDCRESICDDYG